MANGKLQFRIGTQDDAAQLQQLVQSAFRAADSRPNWTGNVDFSSSFTIDVKDIITKITNPDSAMILATDNEGNLVGTIGVAKHNADAGRLFLLAVDQNRNRGGIGRQVLAYGEDYCRKTWDVTKLEMNALNTREELISWYLRCGYRKTGELTPFPYEHFEDRVLPDGLCFVELGKDA
ncbi:Fc.00g104580.m01.CDS01 [Cosmosporella sp. VM-42]